VWHDRIGGFVIEPSLYAADFARLGDQIERLMDAGARVFHFDIGDGRFIEPITMGPIVLESLAPMIEARGGILDCHLMVVEPERHFRQIAAAGGHSVTFHVEACEDVPRAIDLARDLRLGVGIAFNPETEAHDALAAAEGVDLVLCMSIHPGYSGQRFMPEALGRIAALRLALADDVLVQVDGGISAENLDEVHASGADLIVAGTSIFGRKDVAAAYLELASELARA
jgi:ribulose-phosphate 3-epimerase